MKPLISLFVCLIFIFYSFFIEKKAWGKLPLVFAEAARKKGVTVIGFAIKDMALPEFDRACSKVHWFGTEELAKFAFLLLAERVKKIAMFGKVDKSVIYRMFNKGKALPEFLKKAADKRDYSLLEKITSEFKKVGVEVIDGSEYLKELSPPKGVLTKKRPSSEEESDISFGLGMAREIARLDIGQMVVVKNKSIVSIEAMEGTDETIKRGGALCGKGFSVVKVARPDQDMRWDVPLVGPDTIKAIASADGGVLAIEDKSMYMMEKDTCLELADRNDISIVVI